MSQSEKIKNKLLKQAKLIMSKIKPQNNQREVSNHEMELLLVQYSVFGKHAEISEERMEELHRRLARLDKSQMELVSLRYWDGMTFREIAKVVGVSHDTVNRHMNQVLEILCAD